MVAALDAIGNPSSVHAEGREARGLVEAARERVALLVEAEPRHVVLTASGTEANMLALSPRTGGPWQRRLVSATAHPSVRLGVRVPAVETVGVPASGLIDLVALACGLAEGSPPLVSIMLANNETGVLQPIKEAARLVHAVDGLLHVDAVQAAGRIPCDINALEADLLTLSGHKIGGPKGAGALVKRAPLDLHPLVTGGGQERGERAGTENVAAIAGFGAAAGAAEANLAAESARMRDLRDRLD